MSENNLPQFQIQKVYTKDVSFSIPNSDKIWTLEWKPNLKTDVKVEAISLPEENTYETVITVDVKVKNSDTDAFNIEVKQAGIFTATNMSQEQVEHAKNAFCPNILYHYAREVISDLVISGGFPQLALSPINFDAMYQETLQQAESDKQH